MAQRYQRQIQALGSAVWLTLVTEDNEASAAVLDIYAASNIALADFAKIVN